jgi:hypothetical protein
LAQDHPCPMHPRLRRDKPGQPRAGMTATTGRDSSACVPSRTIYPGNPPDEPEEWHDEVRLGGQAAASASILRSKRLRSLGSR